MSLFAGLLAPKEYDEIVLEPPVKPTHIKYKKAGTLVRELVLTYEGENLEKVEVAV